MFRRIVYWGALWGGLIVGLLIFMLSATGLVLTYEQQITTLAARPLDAPSANAEPLSLDGLIAASGAAPGQSVILAATAGARPVLRAGSRRTMLDPQTGTALLLSPGVQLLMDAVRALHHWSLLIARPPAAPALPTDITDLTIAPILPVQSYQTLLGGALDIVPDWRTADIAVPQPTQNYIAITIDEGFQPSRQRILYLDRLSGALAAETSGAARPFGARLRSWLRFVHTGQTISGLTCLVAMLLTGAGIAYILRRMAAMLRSRPERLDP